MSYLDEFEKEFSQQLVQESNTDALIHWVSEKILASYRNGLTAGKKGVEVKRQGESRRRGSYGKAQ